MKRNKNIIIPHIQSAGQNYNIRTANNVLQKSGRLKSFGTAVTA
jgi:hypothetical protein